MREDRAIEFSRDGGRVAFQNREDGVFVASADGQGLTKIFQPDASVLATSRPLSNPVDGRLIFATAQSLEDQPGPPVRNDRPAPADGTIAWPIPVRYTCWLSIPERHNAIGPDEPPAADGQPAEVKKLFEARCGHLGYISGGLAVKWHPDGQHVLYCAQLDNNPTQHSVFEFDLQSGQSRRVFPEAADAVIFDWSPGGSHLVCVTGNYSQDGGGIWIGSPADEKSWWRVPGSEYLAAGPLTSLIEQLRASSPKWTLDEQRFAFVSASAAARPETTSHRLQIFEMVGHNIIPIAESKGQFSDLHWSPDGTRLGYIERDDAGQGTLSITDLESHVTKLASSESIRRFAGFDPSGNQIAYVVASHDAADSARKHWAILLQPALQRDSVMIGPADLSGAGQQVFSGMQVTFPKWSPTENRLSLWLTFVPRYESLFSIYGRTGLWPGDPAATIETLTGAISWMAVSPQEELQIGHYFLMRGNPEQAWQWYVKARLKLPATAPPANWDECLRRAGAPERSQMFEAICLNRLGREAQAVEKWNEFEANFYPSDLPAAVPQQPPAAVEAVAPMQSVPQDPVMKSLIRDLLIAEIFLSVNGEGEAIAHFRKPAGPDEAIAAALSRAAVLTQLLLIGSDHEGYVAHATDVLAPLALKLWQPEQPGQAATPLNATLQSVVGSCLVPLFCPEYLEQIPEELCRQQRSNWKELGDCHNAGLPAVAIDLVRRAFSKRLNDAAEVDRAERRITANPAATQLMGGRSIDEWLRSLLPEPRQVSF